MGSEDQTQAPVLTRQAAFSLVLRQQTLPWISPKTEPGVCTTMWRGIKFQEAGLRAKGDKRERKNQCEDAIKSWSPAGRWDCSPADTAFWMTVETQSHRTVASREKREVTGPLAPLPLQAACAGEHEPQPGSPRSGGTAQSRLQSGRRAGARQTQEPVFASRRAWTGPWNILSPFGWNGNSSLQGWKWNA